MYKQLISVLCGISLMFTATSVATAAETSFSSEADYLSLAEKAITEATQFDADPKLDEALRAIRSIGFSFVESANNSLKQAFKITPRAETKAALEQVSEIAKSYLNDASKYLAAASQIDHANAQEIASAQSLVEKTLVGTTNKPSTWQFKEDPAVDIIISLLAPILAACVALAVLIDSGKPSGSSAKRVRSSQPRSQFDEAIRKLKYLATDLTVPDDEIIELRNNARSLRLAT